MSSAGSLLASRDIRNYCAKQKLAPNKRKALCLANEMEALNELEAKEAGDCPAADATTGLSPAVWTTIGFVNDALGSFPVAENVSAPLG